MDARPLVSDALPICMHAGEPPRATEPGEAAAAFRQCTAMHMLPAAMEALHAAEINLRALLARVEHAQAAEMSRRVALQKRIQAVFGLVESARYAHNVPLPAAASGAASVLVPESDGFVDPEAGWLLTAPTRVRRDRRLWRRKNVRFLSKAARI